MLKTNAGVKYRRSELNTGMAVVVSGLKEVEEGDEEKE